MFFAWLLYVFEPLPPIIHLLYVFSICFLCFYIKSWSIPFIHLLYIFIVCFIVCICYMFLYKNLVHPIHSSFISFYCMFLYNKHTRLRSIGDAAVALLLLAKCVWERKVLLGRRTVVGNAKCCCLKLIPHYVRHLVS